MHFVYTFPPNCCNLKITYIYISQGYTGFDVKSRAYEVAIYCNFILERLESVFSRINCSRKVKSYYSVGRDSPLCAGVLRYVRRVREVAQQQVAQFTLKKCEFRDSLRLRRFEHKFHESSKAYLLHMKKKSSIMPIVPIFPVTRSAELFETTARIVQIRQNNHKNSHTFLSSQRMRMGAEEIAAASFGDPNHGLATKVVGMVHFTGA